jgi:hypothetical protein
LTDLLGGAVLGVAFALAFQARAVREHLARPLLHWETAAPLSFYAFAWFFTYELARMFEDFRLLLTAVLHAVKG